MKTILESLRENIINECGPSGYWGACGRWISYDEEYRERQREERERMAKLKKEAEKIDKDIVDEYKKLQTAYKRKTNTYYDSRRKVYELTDEMTNIKNKAMGIANVVGDFGMMLNNKPSMTRTFTITNNVLKLIAHIIGEEMDESNMVDDKLSDALKKIKDML